MTRIDVFVQGMVLKKFNTFYSCSKCQSKSEYKVTPIMVLCKNKADLPIGHREHIGPKYD